jgi:hypothetical protein
MDTREKIVTAEKAAELLQSGEWMVTIGLFDPLTAAQAKRLADLREPERKLFAVILDQPDSLLDAEARAVLIAALRDVDAVFISEPSKWSTVIPRNGHVQIMEDTEGEQARSTDFIDFVLARQAERV